MRNVVRIYPAFPIETTRGQGTAHFLIDAGIETDIGWLVALDNGEWWEFTNADVRSCINRTIGRTETTKVDKELGEISAHSEKVDSTVMRLVRAARYIIKDPKTIDGMTELNRALVPWGRNG